MQTAPKPEHDPVSLTMPCAVEALQSLQAGQTVSISGVVHTGRDRLHRFLYDGGTAPVSLAGGALYHCGPVAVSDQTGGWRITAAGPTTSLREEPYMARLIARLGLRVIIGKGGMGSATVSACRQYGCIYVQAVGGAAVALARCVKAVRGVWFMDRFGATEAMWALDVVGMKGIVGIDHHGNSLYADIAERSRRRLMQQIAAAG